MANQFQGLIRFFLIGSLVTVFLLTKINTFTLYFKVRSSAGPWPVPPDLVPQPECSCPSPVSPYPQAPRGRLLAAPHMRAAAMLPVLGDQKGTAASEKRTSGPQSLLLWNSFSSSVKWLEV